MRATYHVHLILFDFIIVIILHEAYHPQPNFCIVHDTYYLSVAYLMISAAQTICRMII
jgi:hypothetical protein